MLFILITRPGYRLQNESIDQVEDLKEYTLKFSYTKLPDKTIRLEAELTKGPPSNSIPVSDKPITFFAEDTARILLGEVQTGSKGTAILDVSPEYKLPRDGENQCLFTARLVGDKKEGIREETKLIKNINVDFEFTVKYGEKFVNVNITEPGNNKKDIPVSDALVYAYVERLFSLYEFGADFSDEEGKLVFDFPGDMPGDKNGNLNIIVRIPESEEYGNVEVARTINWGIPVPVASGDKVKTLWSDEAPLWMIIAVMVILGGAWFNFFLALSKILKIRSLK